jgi:hypothetical protein
MDIRQIARTLNELSRNHPIGHLQELRTQLRGKPSRTHAIFTASTIFPDYAYHDGGRHELQFNIGTEEMDRRAIFRYGIAFSLETSRSLPDVSELFPKIDRFNYYLRTNPSAFPGFLMWYWIGKTHRSPDFYPRPIEQALAQVDNFIFFGKWVDLDQLDLEDVLNELDGLLPVYAFVEGGDYLQTPAERPTAFRPGCSIKKVSTRLSRIANELDIALRHNELQSALYKALSKEYGANQVTTEFCVESAGRVDAVIIQNGSMTFYEIKVAPSARSALREAFGQLLEYAYWPNASRANELVVVGEAAPTYETKLYLNNLRRRFGLQLSYRQLNMEQGELRQAV